VADAELGGVVEKSLICLYAVQLQILVERTLYLQGNKYYRHMQLALTRCVQCALFATLILLCKRSFLQK